MNKGFLLLVFTALLNNACVKAPVYKEENHAFVKSSHAIIKVNNEQIEPAYAVNLKAGENTLVVLYRTYRHDYYCEFQWHSIPQTAYEITDQENKYPLTLYRWKKQNDLWASRLDPVDPVNCTKKND